MKRIKLLALILAAFVTLSACQASYVISAPSYAKAETSGGKAASAVKDAIDAFSLESFKLLTDNTDGNIAYSPMSMYLALAMLFECVDEGAKEEIAGALNISDASLFTEELGRLILNNYADESKHKVRINNSIWLKDGLSWDKDIVDKITGNFKAGFYKLLDPKASRKNISKWINDATDGMIDNITPEIDDETAMILINAILFKDAWKKEFDENATYEGDFYLKNGETVKADYMRKNVTYFPVIITDGYTLLDLEFKNGGKMTFIMPNEGYSLNEVIDSINNENEREWRCVNLSLPKFDISFKESFAELLNNMGINKIFDEAGGCFEAFLNKNDVYVSEIMQSAKVKINEEGVEAAAVTVIEAAGSALPEEPVDITFDKPFYFKITGDNGDVLFVGRVSNPAEK